ncbi:autotransporter outer membrane beta-barrel domain-containing protein [Devosia ginsengisoli]|uniref:Autotransporter outer membrane beta-barrel domain-containing protein n=1 Tax=Devosia ginsengisoli TaxID=400770 RepID=A0A5B8LY23_9HYPH|nr:autotransporter outer membrane beta-barrel domain-containing protein [Devosia ginsengisoli]
MTVSGQGSRLVATGTSFLDVSAGSASYATITIEDGGYFGADSAGLRFFGTSPSVSDAVANVLVTGQGSTLSASSFSSGSGTGYYSVRDGGQINVGSMRLGTAGASVTYGNGWSTVEVVGNGSRWDSTGILELSRGTLSILEGGVMTGTGITIARPSRGATEFSALVSGAGSELRGDTIAVGTGGKGVLTIADDGKVVVGGGAAALVLGGTAADSDGTLNIGGAAGEAAAAAGTLEASAVTLAASGAVNFNHTETGYVFDLPINGNGEINQVAGHTIFNADQAGFTGLASVRGGTLAVNGDLGGTMDIYGGRLQGTGTVGATTNHAGGTIAPGNSIGTLTVAGNYTSNGGTLEIESVLGGDGSPSDLLLITGDSILGTGPTQVGVINLGGAGAPTIEGIKIVDVGGLSDAGAFALAGDYVFEGDQAVVGGAYAYRLYQNGVSTPADGDWYLRSSLAPVIPPVPPVTPPAPLYQPGVPLYESYANVLQSFNALGTLQQRVGNRSWSGAGVVDTGTPADGTIEGNGAWGRIEAGHANFNPKTSTSGAQYDVDLWRLQAGVDGLLYDEEAGRLIGGISGHYGTISSDIASIFGDGSISSTGYGLGGTLTWYANNGFYLDGQAQVSWYDSNLSSRTAGLGLTSGNNGFGYGLSIEGGQKIALGPNWSVTPQAQLAYSEVKFDDFTDAFGASVGLDRSSSLKGRLGISADYQNEWHDEGGQISRSHVYGIANLYYDFLDGSQTDVAGVKFTSENDPLWGGIGIGGSYNWGDDKYSLFGEASANTSLGNFGDSYTLKGNAGLRVKF